MRIIDLPIEELELSLEIRSEGYSITGIVKTSSDIHVVVAERVGLHVRTFYVSSDGWSGGRTGHQVVRPKKRKKTFIKTLKELVDSGWTFGEDGCLHFPDSNFAFAPRMSAFLGQEIDYSPSSPQGIWTWTPEMLIEKEV